MCLDFQKAIDLSTWRHEQDNRGKRTNECILPIGTPVCGDNIFEGLFLEINGFDVYVCSRQHSGEWGKHLCSRGRDTSLDQLTTLRLND